MLISPYLLFYRGNLTIQYDPILSNPSLQAAA